MGKHKCVRKKRSTKKKKRRPRIKLRQVRTFRDIFGLRKRRRLNLKRSKKKTKKKSNTVQVTPEGTLAGKLLGDAN